MDTTTDTRGGDRSRAAFGHLVQTQAGEPRRAARLSRLAGPSVASMPAKNSTAPVASRADSHQREITQPDPSMAVPARHEYDIPASPALRTVAPRPNEQAEAAATPGGRSAPSSMRRYALMGALALLLCVPLVKKLGPFGAGTTSSAAIAPAPHAAETNRSAPTVPQAKPAPAMAQAAAGPAESTRARRRSETVIDVATGDPRMAAARDRARTGLATFWQHAASPRPGESDFALKVALATRSGSLEHIWSAIEGRNGDAIRVRISNDPVDIAGVKLGSVLTVSEAQISDWMFRRNGRIVGAESLRVLVDTMPPAEAQRYRAMLETP